MSTDFIVSACPSGTIIVTLVVTSVVVLGAVNLTIALPFSAVTICAFIAVKVNGLFSASVAVTNHLVALCCPYQIYLLPCSSINNKEMLDRKIRPSY